MYQSEDEDDAEKKKKNKENTPHLDSKQKGRGEEIGDYEVEAEEGIGGGVNRSHRRGGGGKGNGRWDRRGRAGTLGELGFRHGRRSNPRKRRRRWWGSGFNKSERALILVYDDSPVTLPKSYRDSPEKLESSRHSPHVFPALYRTRIKRFIKGEKEREKNKRRKIQRHIKSLKILNLLF